MSDRIPHTGRDSKSHLARRLTLPLTVLFGLGVTIGAGIYVLIGATVGRAGMHAPLAFILAALVMAPTAAAFAEFAARYPVSAGEAAYVEVGFGSKRFALVIGLMVIAVGIIAAAAISRGSAGYIREFVALPISAIVPLVVLVMGAIAAWGIIQSVVIAAAMTVIEIAGLLAVILVGVVQTPDLASRLPELWTGLSGMSALSGALGATLLAFFAFIGFEGLANIAEEVKEPERTLPKAIFLTLAISTVFYVLVVWVALMSVPHTDLAISAAPLSLVFERITGASPAAISAIAVIATTNGIIAQIVMAARVMFGLAERNLLPPVLAQISPHTQTPLIATAVVVAAVLVLASAFPLEGLAEMTSRLTLIVFAAVNGALVQFKRTVQPMPEAAFTVPIYVPFVGYLLCVGLLVADIVG
jgi:basic amino acid/polyamine antiporter, APA family